MNLYFLFIYIKWQMDRRITTSNHYIHTHRTINEKPVMEFKEVVEDRYSCKKFNGEPVAEKALKAILEAGRVAPTAKNLQEQHVYVVQSPEKLALIDELTPCRYGATTVLVVAFNKENVFTYPGGTRDSDIEDATIVATHMMLAAKNAGVDSCWVNFFNPEEVAEKLELPENGPIIHVLGADLRDGTPIFDIKPYIPFADCHPDAQGGFIDEAPWQELTVHCPAKLLQAIPEEKREGLLEVLGQDPRRAGSKHEPERTYHLAYAGFDIAFTVDNTNLHVQRIEPAIA